MKKDGDGATVKHIQGQDYEQVAVTPNNEGVPDPRVGGTAIFFDSRLDTPT